MSSGTPSAAAVERGQRIYTPFVLHAYDLLVLRVSNRFAWRCPSATMLEQYDRHLGQRHLDLGVGTGWFLDNATWPVEQPAITLLDLNENSLSIASRRLARYSPRSVSPRGISSPSCVYHSSSRPPGPRSSCAR